MSKSRGNSINPDELVQRHGADALRTHLMFMGPFDATLAWNERALTGVKRFLERLAALVRERGGKKTGAGPAIRAIVDRLVKVVGDDIAAFKFNTAIARQMEALNAISDSREAIDDVYLQKLIQVLAPFAPFLSQELWPIAGGAGSVHASRWPSYDPTLVQQHNVTLSIQVNGKLRGLLEVEADTPQDAVVEQARALEGVARALSEREVKKIIYIKNRTLNFVV
jgi:leucyl-tRNA synthetase